MKAARFLAGVALLTACSSELPHDAPFDPAAPFEKQAKASLTGTVRLEGEADFSQVTLDLQNTERTYNVDTAANGGLSLTGIVPGTYTLSIRTRYFQAVTETLAVDLGAAVDLGTRTLAPLRGRVLGLATSERIQGSNLVTSGGVNLSLKKTASVRVAAASAPAFRVAAATTGVTLRTLSGSGGDYEFAGVPAGGYRLYASTTETGERVVGDVTVTGEGDITVDPIVLRPLTGYFEILGMANGVPSSTYTSVPNVNLQLQQSNATQVKVNVVDVPTDGTPAGCDLSTAARQALPSNTLLPLRFTTEGKKLVCVSYVDADGKETEPIYGSIISDATPPILSSVQINGGAAVVNGGIVTLQLSAVDTLSGVANYKVKLSGAFTGSGKTYQPTDVFTLAAGDGVQTVWVVFGDHAGNYSTPVSATVLLDTAAPVPSGVSLTKLDGTPLSTGATIADSGVKLVSAVADDTVLEMQITTSGSYAGQPWVPFDPGKIIDLPSGTSSLGVRVRDQAGHVVDIISAFVVTTDTTPPSGTLDIAPTAVTSPAITVQATGSGDAVGVELAFDPGFVTSLGLFTPGPIPVTLPLGDGTKSVYGRFFDAAGNTSALVGDTVILDTTPPQILSYMLSQASPTKDNPVDVQYSVSGAAELRITEGADCGGVREPVGSGTRTFTLGASEGSKSVRLQFFDAAGNASECAVRTIYFDPNPPLVGTLQINFGQATTSSNVVTISFPGVSGATKVMLSEDAGFTGVNWDGFAPAKTFVLSAGNGVKTVYAKVADDARHFVSLPQATITLDTSAPTAPSIFAAVDVTTQTSVLLTLAAGVVQDMMLSLDDPTFASASWETYVGSKVFALTGVDGVKTIYAKFRKANLAETAVVSDTVILDRAAPILPSVRVEGGAAVVASSVVTLNLSAVDAASGLATYKINDVNDFSIVSAKPFQATDLYTLGSGDALKTIWVTIGDKAGIYSAPVSTTVLLDTTAPALVSASIQTIGGTPLTPGDTVADTRVVLSSSVTDLSSTLMMQVSTTGSFAGVIWESYNPNKSIDLAAGSATLAARVRDEAGHITDLISAFALTIDTTGPTSPLLVINGKIGNAVSTTTVSVTLSAADGPVDAEIAYDPGFVTSLGSFTPTGTHSVALPAGDGSKNLYVRFFDAAGNSSALAGDSIILDTAPPYASFTIAEASPTKTNPLTLNYTATGATSFRTVEDAVCGGALEPIGGGTKTFTVSASEGVKSIRMQFFDAVGNASACLLQSVTYDPNPPVVGSFQINFGQAATSSNVVTISFPGVSGATKVILSEDAGFAGADWSSFAASKTLVLSAGNGVKTVYAKVADDAGHIVAIPEQTITLDTTPPTNPSIYAAYDVTTQTAVLMTLSAGLVAEMILSQDDPTFASSTWEPYLGSKVFGLAGTDGTKTIYAKFKKSTGVETAVVSDTVILDRTAPVLPSVSINGGVAVVTADIVTLNLSAVDSTSGLYTYKVNTINNFAALSPKPYQTTDVFALSGADGPKTVWMIYGDRAGHYSAPASATVLLDRTAPSVTSAGLETLGGIALVNGNTVNDTRIRLVSAVTDLTPLEMQVSTNGSFVGLTWEPYSAAKIVDLPGSGTPTISARVRDAAGHVVALVAGVNLTVDTLPPSGASLSAAATAVSTTTLQVQIGANDTGTIRAELSEALNFAGATTVNFASGTLSTPFTLAGGADGLRTIYARYCDTASNCSAPLSVTVILDRVAPSAGIDIVGGAYVKLPGVTLNLAAADFGSGIRGVKMANSLAGLATTAETSFEATKVWTLAAGDGLRTVYLHAIDQAGNTSPVVTDSVTADGTAPVLTSVTLASNVAVTRETSVIVVLAASGAAEMLLSFDPAFAGAAWAPFAASSVVVLSSGDGLKTLYVKLRDAAGNESATLNDSVTLDTTGPVISSVTVNTGAAWSVTTASVSVSILHDGSASQIEVRDENGVRRAKGAWTNPVTINLSNGEGARTITVTAWDAIGNQGAPVFDGIGIDTSKPVGSVAINGGAARVATTSVSLNLAASDTGSGISAVYLANSSAALATTNAVSYDATKVWTLAAVSAGSEAERDVYYQIADAAGNRSVVFTDSISVDRLAPVLTSVSLASNVAVTRETSVNLAVVSSGADEMMVSFNSGFAGASWVSVVPSSTVALSTGDGTKTVYVKLRDATGNESATLSDFVSLDTTGPLITSVTVNSGAAWSVTAASLNVSILHDSSATEIEIRDENGVRRARGVWTNPVTLNLSNGEGARTISVIAWDSLGNQGAPVFDGIGIDTSKPVGRVAINSGAARSANESVTVNLAASDTGSGIAAVYLANSSAALATTNAVSYDSTKAWTLTSVSAGSEIVRDVYYQIADAAGNRSVVYADSIAVDRQLPTGTIGLAAAVTSQTLIAVNLAYSADAAAMKLSAGNACAGGTWTEANTTPLFSLAMLEGTQYVSVQFRDSVGNESSCYAAAVIFDTQGPVPAGLSISGNLAASPGYTNVPNLVVNSSSTALDCAGYAISEDIGFISAGSFGNGCALTNLSYPLLDTSEGIHTLYVRYQDTLGNWGPVIAESIVLDTSGPSAVQGGFSIVEGEYVASPTITLSMTASGADEMSIANLSVCSSTWLPFTSSHPLVLNGPDGVTTVSAKFRNLAGSESACYQRQVTLDTDAPTFSAALAGAEGNPLRTAREVVTLATSSASSDAIEMRISNTAGFPSALWQPLLASQTWVLAPSDGGKTVFVQIRDRAGNVSVVATPGIALDQTPPPTPTLQVLDTNADGFALAATNVELAWNASSDPNVQGYVLERLVSGVDSAFKSVALFGASPPFTFADPVTQPGRTHSYRMRALDDLGLASGDSNIAQALPFQPITRAAWFRRNDDIEVLFPGNPGTFTLQPFYRYYDGTFAVDTLTSLAPNQPRYARTVPDSQIWTEDVVVRAANQDNSLAYESTIPFHTIAWMPCP